MGALTSRQHAGVEEVDIPSNSVYRYPPKSGEGAARAGEEVATLLGGGSGGARDRVLQVAAERSWREGGRSCGRSAGVLQGPWRGRRGGQPSAGGRDRPAFRLPCDRDLCLGDCGSRGAGCPGRRWVCGPQRQVPFFTAGAPFPMGSRGPGEEGWHRKHAPVLGGGPSRSIRPQRGTGAGSSSVSQGPAHIDCQRKEAENALTVLMLFQGLSEGKRSV